MTLDPVILSRLQFFWVVSFHILLPAFTVGLACYIAVLEAFYLKTKDVTYFRISIFWTKIFAVSFGLGVVTGIVMPFQPREICPRPSGKNPSASPYAETAPCAPDAVRSRVFRIAPGPGP